MHEDVGAVLHELRDDLLVLAGEVQHLLLDPTAAQLCLFVNLGALNVDIIFVND